MDVLIINILILYLSKHIDIKYFYDYNTTKPMEINGQKYSLCKMKYRRKFIKLKSGGFE